MDGDDAAAAADGRRRGGGEAAPPRPAAISRVSNPRSRFVDDKGRLAWPVSGSVTKNFGDADARRRAGQGGVARDAAGRDGVRAGRRLGRFRRARIAPMANS